MNEKKRIINIYMRKDLYLDQMTHLWSAEDTLVAGGHNGRSGKDIMVTGGQYGRVGTTFW